MAGGRQRRDGSVAHRRGERTRVRMAVDDVRLHSERILASTFVRNSVRASVVELSMPYNPSHVRRVSRPMFSRNARIKVRRPLSCIAATFHLGAPYVEIP